MSESDPSRVGHREQDNCCVAGGRSAWRRFLLGAPSSEVAVRETAEERRSENCTLNALGHNTGHEVANAEESRHSRAMAVAYFTGVNLRWRPLNPAHLEVLVAYGSTRNDKGG
jgi:hypothetical protein